VRTTFIVASVVTIILAGLLFSLHVARERATEAMVVQMPSLADAMAAQNRIAFAFQLTGAFVFLGMVVVVTLLETHKTAGAAFNLTRQMGNVRDGEYGTRVTLRRGDNLQSLGHAFNEMSIALDERFWRDIELLDGLAHQAQRISNPDEARQLVAVLSQQASERRRKAGLPEDDEQAPAEPPARDQEPVTVSSE
jgi:methyl-accepting chemotaxis protein